MAGGFGQAHIARDDGVEHEAGEVFFQLLAHFQRQAALRVVHGAHDAEDIELGIDSFADFAHGGDEVGNALEGVVFAHHGHDEAVGGHEAVEGEQGEGGRAVDEDVVVFGQKRLDSGFEAHLAGDFLNQLHFGAGQGAVGTEDVVAAVRAFEAGIGSCGLLEQHLISAAAQAAFVDAAAGGGVALRVEINHQHALFAFGQGSGQIDGGGGFAHAAFLVGYGDNGSAHHPAFLWEGVGKTENSG